MGSKTMQVKAPGLKLPRRNPHQPAMRAERQNPTGSDLRPWGRNRGYDSRKPAFVKEHSGVIADPYIFPRVKFLYIYAQRFRWFSKYRSNLPSSRSVVESDEFVSDSDVGMKLIRFFTSSG